MEDELRATLEAVVARLRAVEAPRERFRIAGRLTDALREAAGLVAQARADAVAEIYDREQVSLAALANSLGVTKARAAQLVDKAQGKHEGGG